MAAESGCSMCSEKVQGQGLGKVRVNVAWRLCGGQQMPEGCSHAKVGGWGWTESEETELGDSVRGRKWLEDAVMPRSGGIHFTLGGSK